MACLLILVTSLVVIASSQPINEETRNVGENLLLKHAPNSPHAPRILNKRQADGFGNDPPPNFGQRGSRNRTNNSGNRRGPPGSRNMTGCSNQMGGMGQGRRGQGGMGQGGMGQGGMGQGGMGQGGMDQGGMGQGGMGQGGMGGMGQGGMGGMGGMGGGGPGGPPPGMDDSSSLVKTYNSYDEEHIKAYAQNGGGGGGRGGFQRGGMGCSGNFTGQNNSGGSRRGPPQGGNMMGPPPGMEDSSN